LKEVFELNELESTIQDKRAREDEERRIENDVEDDDRQVVMKSVETIRQIEEGECKATSEESELRIEYAGKETTSDRGENFDHGNKSDQEGSRTNDEDVEKRSRRDERREDENGDDLNDKVSELSNAMDRDHNRLCNDHRICSMADVLSTDLVVYIQGPISTSLMASEGFYVLACPWCNMVLPRSKEPLKVCSHHINMLHARKWDSDVGKMHQFSEILAQCGTLVTDGSPEWYAQRGTRRAVDSMILIGEKRAACDDGRKGSKYIKLESAGARGSGIEHNTSSSVIITSNIASKLEDTGVLEDRAQLISLFRECYPKESRRRKERREGGIEESSDLGR